MQQLRVNFLSNELIIAKTRVMVLVWLVWNLSSNLEMHILKSLLRIIFLLKELSQINTWHAQTQGDGSFVSNQRHTLCIRPIY